VIAGCDNFDSDGDGQKDNCEDRFPPELFVRNPEIFICDESDTGRLCHNGNVFKNEKQVSYFLEFQFFAMDDCQPSDEVVVIIDKQGGSCSDTVYTVRTYQDVAACNGIKPTGPFNISYINPLYGLKQEVTVQLDDKAPVVVCGFHPPVVGINTISQDGKTLYHYIVDADQF
jgi:hypothetical protein